MGAFFSLFSSCMSAKTDVIHSILKSEKMVSKWRGASGLKKTGFEDKVEVFYFDRCPQYDHAPRNNCGIPVGMSSRSFHSQLEPLASEDRETRGNIRRVLLVQRKQNPGRATSSRHWMANLSYSAPSLTEGYSSFGMAMPYFDSSYLEAEEEVNRLDTIFIPTIQKKKRQEKRKRSSL